MNFDWDLETGGIILKDISSSKIPFLGSLRPVFFEELDLLGFDKHWKYERVSEPLLWAVGRKYFYKGEVVAVVKGGSLFTPPKVICKENLKLNPVDLKRMIERNKLHLEKKVQESTQLIREVYDSYKEKVDIFAVAFSGGKDSVVLLDLVQRVLEPSQFFVVFNDTWMEISDTYKTVEESKKHWSHLAFYTAKSRKDALTTWREMGPPSRIHRWCCTVHKSAPTLLFLREITNKPSVRALIFDGIRGEEGFRRAGYGFVSEGGKHLLQTNASPMLRWNSAEIYLYIFYRSLPLNPGYRKGLSRVGCAVCPFSSEWAEMIAGKVYIQELEPFLDELRLYASKCNASDLENFVERGKWKSRAGGKFLEAKNRTNWIFEDSKISLDIEASPSKWLAWLKTIGKVVLNGSGKVTLLRNGSVYSFYIHKVSGSKKIIVESSSHFDSQLKKYLRAISLKSAYCVQCGACEVECPTGALRFEKDKVSIDSKRCIQCQSCLRPKKPCLRAASLKITEGRRKPVQLQLL